ncbi:MAG: hypothetical protein ABL893_04535 [Hyphomicrobium sp.]|nr:hypothetical protein [Hyphomicrobium sp.]
MSKPSSYFTRLRDKKIRVPGRKRSVGQQAGPHPAIGKDAARDRPGRLEHSADREPVSEL